MQKTETLNLRVSMDFKRRLVEEAKKEKRSVTNYIEAALSDYWDSKATGKKSKATKERGE
jgi:predicted HicB family RNase H-like nuclease